MKTLISISYNIQHIFQTAYRCSQRKFVERILTILCFPLLLVSMEKAYSIGNVKIVSTYDDWTVMIAQAQSEIYKALVSESGTTPSSSAIFSIDRGKQLSDCNSFSLSLIIPRDEYFINSLNNKIPFQLQIDIGPIYRTEAFFIESETKENIIAIFWVKKSTQFYSEIQRGKTLKIKFNMEKIKHYRFSLDGSKAALQKTHDLCIQYTSHSKSFQDKLHSGGLGPEMVWIPASRFQMGDLQGNGDDDEQPVHWVKVAQFAMGKYEVTLGDFKKFVNKTGHRVKKVEWCNWQSGKFAMNERQPVQCVSWLDAVAYTKWLSQQTGQSYRLPTEAEWEYAARGGTNTAYFFGNSDNQLGNYAWFKSNSNDMTHAVGQKKQNPFGLYDILGNVWEFTCSEYESRYSGKEKKCVNKNNIIKITLISLRGASFWDGDSNECQAAYRYFSTPFNRGNSGGFRVVLAK